MIQQRADRPGRSTLGADKTYDGKDLVNELRSMNVTPHVEAKATGSAIDGRAIRHTDYANPAHPQANREAFRQAKPSS
jgi:hypothetical protein